MTQVPTFGMQAAPLTQSGWIETARRCEDLGFTFLSVADHPGSSQSPFTSLGAAASVTTTLRLGPYVANAGLRHPIDIATDVATLDIISDGRAVLGLGAGHAPEEWSVRSMTRPSATERVHRLISVARAVKSLLEGETVSLDQGVLVNGAVLHERLVRPNIPMLIGGNNRHLLSYAASCADIIGFTGLGRTLEGGHRHETRWTAEELTATFGIADAASGPRAERQALVQWAEISNDPDQIVQQISDELEVPSDQVLSAPFVLVGTSAHDIAEQVLGHRERYGIDSYVVRERSIDDIAQVIAALDQS